MAFRRLRRKRPCVCTLTHAWHHESLVVELVAPTGNVVLRPGSPLPLAVDAVDTHRLEVVAACEHHCEGEDAEEPTPPDRAAVDVVLPASVTWEVVNGPGGFVTGTEAAPTTTASGGRALYQPPVLAVGEEAQVRLRVIASHTEREVPAGHGAEGMEIRLALYRTAAEEIAVTVRAPARRGGPAGSNARAGGDGGEGSDEPLGCRAEVEVSPGPATVTVGPVQPGGGYVAFGDLVLVEAVASATSQVTMRAVPTGHCAPASATLTVATDAELAWECSAGEFVAPPRGRTALWTAPSESGRAKLTAWSAGRAATTASVTVDVVAIAVGIDPVPSSWQPDARAGRLPLVARTFRQEGGRWVAPGRPAHGLVVRLEEVSREPGVCGNAPLAAARHPDLFFAADANRGVTLLDDGTDPTGPSCPTDILEPGDNPAHDGHWLAAMADGPVVEQALELRCEDYGAHALVVATAPGFAVLEGTPVPHSFPGTPDDDADGDGLTDFEEWRGFILDGTAAGRVHVRTDPRVPDVFVRDRDAIGVGPLAEAGVAVRLINDPDLWVDDDTRLVNFNRASHGRGDQHGILLVREALGGALRGRVFGESPGTPGQIDRVAVDVAAIAREGIEGMGDRVRAHLLGHAIGIPHHGDGEPHDGCGPRTDRSGGPTSGDPNCVMRMPFYTVAWCDGREHHRHAVASDTIGTTFCSSASASGVNQAGGHANDATNGNCRGLIRIRDWS